MLQCTFRAPDRLHFDGDAVEVAARSARGPFVILPGHAALAVALEPGVVRIKTPEGPRTFACFGGTLFVDHDRVSIASADVQPADTIDLDAPRRQLDDPTLDSSVRERVAARLAVLEQAVEGRV